LTFAQFYGQLDGSPGLLAACQSNQLPAPHVNGFARSRPAQHLQSCNRHMMS
jgi:hypothetical protein